MSIKYDSKRESLFEIIRRSTIDSTYVIPDLQRPFVWNPSQVIMLIDSLFRGWPFGSLLLWEVKPDCFDIDEGIPHRPFWRVVDRTGDDNGTTVSSLAQPATYLMVLDGQQRIQSLLLALGGDEWGFKLMDSEWASDLDNRRVKASNHWSKASLCVDLIKFIEEVHSKDNEVRKIEISKILKWVVTDHLKGKSTEIRPANYVYPLFSARENPGRFIRLSRFWDLLQKGLPEREYKRILKPVLQDHGSSDFNLLDPLAEFMKVFEDVKNNSFFHALQIESFVLSAQWGRNDYCDAIVNIFTRLNTAGRTLTREEITLAWLKIGWNSSKTNGESAGNCLNGLIEYLKETGFNVETDDIVRLISFVWSVENRSGRLLDSRDLLKGEIVRPMADYVATIWNKFRNRVENGAVLIDERELINGQSSFNAIIIYLSWFYLLYTKLESILNGMSVIDGDALEKELDEVSMKFLDRWVFGSQWANVWGDGAVVNFQNFAYDLSAYHNELKTSKRDNIVKITSSSIEQLIGRISGKAIENINTISVKSRSRVHSYFQLLWVWHRLEKDRWENSSIPMRTGRKKKSKLEVDHTISDSWWKKLVNEEIDKKCRTFVGPDEDRLSISPDGFLSKDEAFEYINSIGNCSLLDKSFNISKSDKSMWDFLKDVKEFRDKTLDRVKWEKSLALTQVLTNPTGKTLAELRIEIQSREIIIKKEIIDFINGTKSRVE